MVLFVSFNANLPPTLQCILSLFWYFVSPTCFTDSSYIGAFASVVFNWIWCTQQSAYLGKISVIYWQIKYSTNAAVWTFVIMLLLVGSQMAAAVISVANSSGYFPLPRRRQCKFMLSVSPFVCLSVSRIMAKVFRQFLWNLVRLWTTVMWRTH